MERFNPFTPNSPAHSGMFVGRGSVLRAFDKALAQTAGSNPTHLLILGERGIGKTSLLNVAQMFSRGEMKWDDDTKHDFLTVRLALTENICLADFVITFKKAIEREVQKDNPDIALVQKVWGFVSRLEIAGVSLRREESEKNETQIIQDAAYSLVDTIKVLRDGQALKQKQGVVVLIDEADKASRDLHLGSFLKNLTEMLKAETQNHVLFILTGLPNLRDVLAESHESSLRLFTEYSLEPLNEEETGKVIKRGLDEVAGKIQSHNITIDSKAIRAAYVYSEGYPHFVQQIGYSAFDVDTDNKISEEDVKKGFFMENGGLEQIGERYYSRLFYKEISTESQRNILEIMSENWNNWTKREDIKNKFKGKEKDMDNGLKALRSKNIIIPREGTKGQYRLQWGSFAFWISAHDRKKHRT